MRDIRPDILPLLSRKLSIFNFFSKAVGNKGALAKIRMIEALWAEKSEHEKLPTLHEKKEQADKI